MTELTAIEQHKSPVVTPQALAWDDDQLWISSRDLKRLYRIDPRDWTIAEEIKPPGGVWAAVAGNDGLYLTIGEGENDDRYVYRYDPAAGFTRLFPCPDLTGSYLSFDGEHLYLSQWYKGRILQLDHNGKIANEINIGPEISGHTIVAGALYVLHGTEEDGEKWQLTRLNLTDERGVLEELAAVPFAARSLAWDGKQFWSNHRAANEIISFRVPALPAANA